VNRAEHRTLVLTWVDDPNAGYFTTAFLNTSLNNSTKEVQKRLIKAGQNYYAKVCQTSTVINQRDYVIPGDLKKTHRLDILLNGTIPNESVQPLTPITWNQQDLIPKGNGMPSCYTLRRNRLTLWPAPSTVWDMRLTYSYLVPDMTLDTDTPDVPADYQELVSLLTAQDCFLKDGRSSELLVKKIAEYQAMMDSDAAQRREDMPRPIRETGEFESGGWVY